MPSVLPVLLLLGGISISPVDLGAPVVDVRVADVDSDGTEDVVALTATELILLRGGKLPAIRRGAPPLTIVGKGLLAVVREGHCRIVADPFGAWNEGAPGAGSLLGLLGRGAPALLLSPGDLDGDGKDDPLLCGPTGYETPVGLVPFVPGATMDIARNESFAIEYRIPLPTVGNWSGSAKELVLFDDEAVRSFRGTEETDRTPLPLPQRNEAAASIRRNQVFLRDVDGDGRLDLLVVVASGETQLFAKFEATARLFRGGHVYDAASRSFFRPVSFLKVAGVLLEAALVDVDGDKDLDLVLCTIDVSIFAAARATAPATYHVFRWDADGYERKPVWTLEDEVPLSAFQEEPEPPVRFLPDYDRDGRPAALSIGEEVCVLLHDGKGFVPGPAVRSPGAKRPAFGEQRAAVPYAQGVVVVEGGK
ncbi:MAG TPA: VCBS repeat-containing protein [Planctomycetota bacterium]|nr:VCBS repeat-containing protein [Planctomycetota bacterium]